MRPQKDATLAKRIGNNLKKLRAKKFPNHGQMREMCEAVGVTPQTWNKWEAGTNVPSDAMQRRLIQLFGVKLWELRGEDAPSDKPGAQLDMDSYNMIKTILEVQSDLGQLASMLLAGKVSAAEVAANMPDLSAWSEQLTAIAPPAGRAKKSS